MIPTQKRGLFWFRRLKNKDVSRGSYYSNNYFDADYVASMKQFQKETRGMLPDSNDAILIRNRLFREMRDRKMAFDERVRADVKGREA